MVGINLNATTNAFAGAMILLAKLAGGTSSFVTTAAVAARPAAAFRTFRGTGEPSLLPAGRRGWGEGGPAEIVARLNDSVRGAVRDPEVVGLLEAQQFFGESSSASELQQLTAEQLEAYRTALRGAGVEPN